MKKYFFCLLSIMMFWACKENTSDELIDIRPNARLSHKTLNVSIDFLQYNHPFALDLNNDSQIDYVFSSVLLEENDLPYLYLFINRKSPHLNRYVVKTSPPLVHGGFWAMPLEKDVRIDNSLNAGSQWSPDLSQGCFISVSNNGSTSIFDGEWLGKKEKYLGLKFLINGKYHYGWLRISHSAGEDRIAILDYAYNKEPGKEIFAGERQ